MKYIFAVLFLTSFVPLTHAKEVEATAVKNTNISVTIMEQPISHTKNHTKRSKEWGVRNVKIPTDKHPKILGAFRVAFDPVENNTETFAFSTPTQTKDERVVVATRNKTLDGSLFLFVENGHVMGKITTNISQLHSVRTAVVEDQTIALPDTQIISFGGAVHEGEQYFDLNGVRYFVYLENLTPPLQQP